ncbi:MAG: DUF1015 family protein [Bacteroidota bacterium]
MNIFPFQAVYPDLDFIASPDSFFGTVKENYVEYKENDFFKKTDREAIYIYQIKSKWRNYLGLVACADIEDYLEGHILKHENTLAPKEQQQMQLLLNRKAMVKPILLTYPDVAYINELLQGYIEKHPPFLKTHFEGEQSEHLFWQLDNESSIQKLQEVFREHIGKSYIADGHHRSSTVALMYQRWKNRGGANPFNRMLCAFFPASQLSIFDYNRIIEGLQEISPTRFMAELSQLCDVEVLAAATKPDAPHQMVLCLDHEWYKLRWKPSVLRKYEHIDPLLDVSLLNEEILKGILQIEDVRTDPRVKYVEGPRGMEVLKNKTFKNEKRMAFLLYPVALGDLMRVADDGKVMPPKSTWFEPRVKNGLLVLEV